MGLDITTTLLDKDSAESQGVVVIRELWFVEEADVRYCDV
jgi:hypothetical protein